MVAQFAAYADRLARSITVDGSGLDAPAAPGEEPPAAAPAGAARPQGRAAGGRGVPADERAADERSRGRREEILLAALDVFAERGFRGASLAAVAERAGLSQQGLLHYFPSKERLLIGMLDLRERIDALRLLADGTAPPRLEQITQLAEYNAGRPGVVQAFTVLSAESVTEDHPAREYFVERYARMRERVEESLRAELGDRLPGGLSPRDAAALLLAVQDGAQLQWLLDPDEVDLPGLVAAFARLLREDDARSRAPRNPCA
ncbi:TetR/AcrR family transcriptional regulator [Bailinhaonella thermotolerans]|uniref:TetR/AcrR family transcriptional regulator n=2 Tax=Bailinhaonella thermotolerans TaxID=1070861 RepID=A0A3A4A5U4_9ACTN|nr:TetR/AcrR family transcriptional regulator [Bailinhaonella thermotolerans]